MEALKTFHVLCAALSVIGFFVRGVWALNDSPRLRKPWVRVAPHVVDTFLLLSAIALAIGLALSPFGAEWLAAKIVALVIYICLGLVALRFARSTPVRVGAWLGALAVFAYIVSVAYTKTPYGFFAALGV